MIRLLEKYHPPGSLRHQVLMKHSRAVAEKAVAIARHLSTNRDIDIRFIEEAALLHDIGIHLTNAPEIGCNGQHPYLMHGILGSEILEQEGYPQHALVCERHIGIGLSRTDIIEQKLPLPPRDMLPLTIEEQIVTYADLFFSKSPDSGTGEREFEIVRERMARHGPEKVKILESWHALFSC